MENLTQKELDYIKELLKEEVKKLEKYEDDFEKYTVNSPFLDTVFRKDSDLMFISSAEKYKKFVEDILNKLK